MTATSERLRGIRGKKSRRATLKTIRANKVALPLTRLVLGVSCLLLFGQLPVLVAVAFTPVLYSPLSYALAQKALMLVETTAVSLIILTVSPWFAERRRSKAKRETPSASSRAYNANPSSRAYAAATKGAHRGSTDTTTPSSDEAYENSRGSILEMSILEEDDDTYQGEETKVPITREISSREVGAELAAYNKFSCSAPAKIQKGRRASGIVAVPPLMDDDY